MAHAAVGVRRLAGLAAALLLAASGAVAVSSVPAGAVANGLAGTPPMGWNGYNRFSHDVTAGLVESEARALVSSGMKSVGYEYVNLDGGWNLLQRDANGELQPDPAKFPDGIKPVADYVHSLGLKFGIYASAGTTNCAVTSAGSYGHYQQDAATFASWGVDYVKFDRCAVPYDNYPDLTHPEVTELLATQMHEALMATGRAMVFDVNDAMQSEHGWTWAPPIANLWRVAGDISDSYTSMVNNFTADIMHAPDVAPGGGWSDPDMLEVGNGGMTDAEYRSQVSLWAELAAPLIAGNDLATMFDQTKAILTNREVIAVDQDPLGAQGAPLSSADGHWVLSKPLAGGDRAVVLFNQSGAPASIATSTDQLGLPAAPAYALRDLWAHTTVETTGAIHATVPPHSAVMYRVSAQPGAAGRYPPQTMLGLSAATPVLAAGQSTTVTATLTDEGLRNLDRVSIDLQLPDGWTATPHQPISRTQVRGGQSVNVRWRVTAPANAAPGTVTLTGNAAYATGPWSGTADGQLALSVPYPSWSAAFNNAGISDDADVAAANLDGVGNSYSAQALAATGLTPGATVTHNGVGFTWPDVPSGQPDNVVAQGQTVLTTGAGTTIGFLGAASPADETGTGTVYYSDGSTSSFTITLDNYFKTPDSGNDIIAAPRYLNDSNPVSNGGIAGRRNLTVYLFYTSAPITPGKTVVAVTLPAGGAMPPGDRITGMHIFALGIGG